MSAEYCRKRSFSLIETTIAIAVFAIVVTAFSGIFMSVQRIWVQQTNDLDLVENLRWAAEFMANDSRQGGNLSLVDNRTISLDLDQDGDGTAEIKVWFWRGDTAQDAVANGNRDFFYRGSGNSITEAYASRQQLANFITDNPSGNPVFSLASGLLLAELSATHAGRNYSLRTALRQRN